VNLYANFYFWNGPTRTATCGGVDLLEVTGPEFSRGIETNSNAPLASNNFFFAVSIGAEDAIVWSGGSFAKIRVHIFPDQFAVSRHFKEPTEITLADEGVAVG
jgi:hypothetical protein